ncbi:hypothetical protein [Geminicoccus flavidas]|uniref:hypothetical protein n=1 Tax=Geminicoccus flavidas TaxID=2506407 RepID=UPI00135A02BD|nr:hypothetical protein [Geminicoccus flavidas]
MDSETTAGIAHPMLGAVKQWRIIESVKTASVSNQGTPALNFHEIMTLYDHIHVWLVSRTGMLYTPDCILFILATTKA